MSKRRLVRWSPLLLVLLAVIFFLTNTGILGGWLRGEAFYKGRPTSYWRAVIERDFQTEPRQLYALVMPAWPPPSDWWNRFKEWIRYPAEPCSHDLVWKEQAHEVLRELAEDPDERISGFSTDAMKMRPWTTSLDHWIIVIQDRR